MELYNPYCDLPEMPDVDDAKSDEQDEVRMKAAMYGCAAYVIGAAVALFLCALMSGCRSTRVVTEVEQRTDTLLRYVTTRDSIFVHDSIVTTHWGDTVRIERWHTRWRDRWRTDTIYIAKTDSVRVPYAVPSEQVAATRLTWWQQTRMYVGDVGFGLLIIFVAAKIIRRKWRYNDRT